MTCHPAAAAALAFALVASACSRQPDTSGPAPKTVASGTFHDAAGARTGVATLTDTAGALRLDLSASRLSPGLHGLHFHAVGVCTPPDFKSAGAHFNPAGKQHGRLNPDGPHLGDLPNIHAGPDSSVDTSLTLSRDLIASGSRSIFQAADTAPGGAALVIHAGPDDERTDPSGNSGDRVACAVLERR
jgi:superoxide dismutase, Cu-Zn family